MSCVSRKTAAAKNRMGPSGPIRDAESAETKKKSSPGKRLDGGVREIYVAIGLERRVLWERPKIELDNIFTSASSRQEV